MKCDVILIYKLPTSDSELELAENQVTLFRKYNGRPFGDDRRKTVCYALQMLSSEKPEVSKKMAEARTKESITVSGDVPDLKGKGSVGIYILCHTADMRAAAVAAAAEIYEKVVVRKGGDVRKISIACCHSAGEGSRVKGIMRDFCDALQTKDTPGGLLRDGMMVCGFCTLITTFDVDPTFMKNDRGQDLYGNADELRKTAPQTGRHFGTVVENRSASTISFTHEKVDDAVAASFLVKSEAHLEDLLKKCWNENKVEILRKLKGQSGKDCTPLSTMSLEEVLLSGPAKLAEKVGGATNLVNFSKALRLVLGMQLFDTALKSSYLNGNSTLGLRQSLEAYLKMKKVLKYKASTQLFVETTLDDYTDNRALGEVLAFVQKDGKRFAAEFFP